MNALGRRWFAPAPAARLGVLRVLVGGWSLYYLGRRRRMFDRIARSDRANFKPIGVVKPLAGPVPPEVARLVTDATLVASVAFTAGIWHRLTGPLYSYLLLWTLTYRNSWSMIFHNDNLLVLHALALGHSRAADALAVDALRGPSAASPHWRYGWPIQLMQTVTTLTYCLAGVAKIVGPLGFRWASGESLRRQVAVDGLRKELLGSHAMPAAYGLYDQVALFRLLATGSLALELLAPAALVHRRAAQGWALNAFAMHWGILALMGIRFRYQMTGLAFASFFPVEKPVLRALGRSG